MNVLLLRHNSAVLVFPFLTVLSIWYVSNLALDQDAYVVSLSAQGNVTIFLIAAVIGGCAAWEGGRWRQSELLRGPYVRNSLAIIGTTLVPVLIGGMLLYIAVLMRATWSIGPFSLPDLRLLVMGSVVLVAGILTGFAMGLHLPRVLAIPLVTVLVFLWLSLPRGLDPVWLISLNGDLSNCCVINQDISNRSVLSTVILHVAVTAGAFLWVRREVQVTRFVLGLVLIGGGTLIASLLASQSSDRDGNLVPRTNGLQCTTTTVTVCLWEEHADQQTVILDQAETATNAWSGAGLATFTAYSEEQPALLDSGEGELRLGSTTSPFRAAFSLADAAVEPLSTCQDTVIDSNIESAITRSEMVAWLLITMGWNIEEVAPIVSFGPDGIRDRITSELQVRLSQPSDEQLTWFNESSLNLSACTRD